MLGKHAGVKEAVVVVKQEAGMEKRLAAYVVGQGRERVTGEELRKYLRERLPEYMVPRGNREGGRDAVECEREGEPAGTGEDGDKSGRRGRGMKSRKGR